jgi:uncharacterized protein YecT (DUF1311 family)
MMAQVTLTRAFLLTIGLLSFVIFGPAQNTQKPVKEIPRNGPCDAARTQSELNQCFDEESRKADAHLSSIYSNLVKQLQGPAVQKLEAAERAWTQYRDLHCDAARYEYEGGSMSPMVFAQCMATTTKHRIDEINAAYGSSEQP